MTHTIVSMRPKNNVPIMCSTFKARIFREMHSDSYTMKRGMTAISLIHVDSFLTQSAIENIK